MYIYYNEGKDIYIIASGKSIDYIDNDFYDSKITIGVNRVSKKLKCNYYVMKECLDYSKFITTIGSDILFLSKGSCGNNTNEYNLNILSINPFYYLIKIGF